ncbi:MAG: hypothetical protein WCC22_06975 [Terriglobales bacterium]
MNHGAALAKKLRALQNRITLIEALMAFLKKHPAVASRTVMWNLSNKPALYFEEKAFIRTVHVKNKVALRLEKYVDDILEEAGFVDKRIVCADVSGLSREELDEVLKKVKIDLSKTDDEEDEEEDS